MDVDFRCWTPAVSPDVPAHHRPGLPQLVRRSPFGIVVTQLLWLLPMVVAVNDRGMPSGPYVAVVVAWGVVPVVLAVNKLRRRHRYRDHVVDGLAGFGLGAKSVIRWALDPSDDPDVDDLEVRALLADADGADLLAAVQHVTADAGTPPADALSLSWAAAQVAVAYDDARRRMPGLRPGPARQRREALDLTGPVARSMLEALHTVATLLRTARQLGLDASAHARGVTADLDRATAVAASLAELTSNDQTLADVDRGQATPADADHARTTSAGTD